MVMWLSSYSRVSLPSRRNPAIDDASPLIPSITSPSEQNAQVRWSTTWWPGRL
jgi:hypothetical protein